MQKISVLAVVISAVSIILPAESYAHGRREIKWKGSGGWGEKTPYNRLYNLKTEMTVSGEVVIVEEIVPLKGMSYGVHFMLKTGGRTISVHLGPAWLIENQDIKIMPGDLVEVTGSRIMLKGEPAIIAAAIKRGAETLKLRDKNGFPVWSGWRRR